MTPLAKDQKAFSRLNRGMALSELRHLAHSIERDWEQSGPALGVLRDRLAEFSERFSEVDLSHVARKLTPSVSARHFSTLMVALDRHWQRKVYDHEHLAIQANDYPRERAYPLPVFLILDHLRSAFNVGAIFRMAECLGVQKIFLTGYTPGPDDGGLGRAAMGCEERVAYERGDVSEVVVRLQESGIAVFAAETSRLALPLNQVRFGGPCAFLLSNERHGLSLEVARQVDGMIEIPLRGQKNSLNVSHAGSLLVYEYSRQWGEESFAGENEGLKNHLK